MKEIELEKIFENIFNFFFHPERLPKEVQNYILLFKIIFLIYGFLFFVFFVYFFRKVSWPKSAFLIDLKEFFTFKPYRTKIYEKKWRKIVEKGESEIEAERKLAILEADSILEEFLKSEGYIVKSLEEELEKIPDDILPEKEEIKRAKEIKKAILEDPAFQLPLEKTREILEIYKKILKNFSAI
jgi:hypothetical protein